jgi:alpha-D-xyloside xylohydrolase
VAGLPTIVPDMLNRAVGGAWGFTTDIAGYLDVDGRAASAEFYLRWSQAAALMPYFRVHNGPIAGPRMPWSYDAATLEAWKAAARLHQRVVPEILAAWDEALATGMPVVRPLWLVDPASARTPHNDDEWLLGPNLLAAPVLAEGARSCPPLAPVQSPRYGPQSQELGLFRVSCG